MVYTKKYLKKKFFLTKKEKNLIGSEQVTITYFSLRTEYKTIALYTKISVVIFKKILETWDKHKQSCSY